MASEAHDGAVQRLDAALIERDRLSVRYVGANGTSREEDAYVRLRTAGDRIAAREAWVSWVDDEGCRGLNAGPIELLAQSAKPARTRGLESRGP